MTDLYRNHRQAQLRAVEGLDGWMHMPKAEYDELRAENERLRTEVRADEIVLTNVINERDRLRAALVQIENWVGKLPSNMGEAALIFEYIDKACEQALGKPNET